MNHLNKDQQAIEAEGQITITTRQECDWITVGISDDGCGMSQEACEKVFDPFFTTKEPGVGTGLGLSISRKLARLLGGNLTASSIAGEGAIFTLTVPMRYQAPKEQHTLQD